MDPLTIAAEMSVFALLLLLTGCEAFIGRDFNRTDECVEQGGQCVSSLTECDFASNVRTGPCDVNSLCCVSMESACETHHEGFCADNPSNCYADDRPGYAFNWVYCGPAQVCCEPVFGSHMTPFGGHGHMMGGGAGGQNMGMMRMPFPMGQGQMMTGGHQMSPFQGPIGGGGPMMGGGHRHQHSGSRHHQEGHHHHGVADISGSDEDEDGVRGGRRTRPGKRRRP